MPRIIVLEVDVWDGAEVVTLRYGTKTINTAASDTPANTTYRGLIVDAGSIQRSVSLLGQVSESRGGLILNNANGELDDLYDYAWGRTFRIKELQNERDSVSNALVVGSGICLGVDSSEPFKQVRLRFRDAMEALNTPLLIDRYLGSTTDGSMTTIEGNVALKDKLKPCCITSRANVTPDLVNEFHLVWKASHRYSGSKQITSMQPRDGGVALTFYADFPNAAALIAATFPAATTTQRYATCLAEGLFRLDDTPQGAVTVDIEAGTAADRSAPRAAQTMLDMLNADGAGIVYDATSFNAMHALCPAEVVLLVDGDDTAGDLIVRVLSWVGLALDPGADGVFRVFAIGAPTGTPERVFTRRDWSTGSFTVGANPQSEGGSVPNYQAVVNYGGVQTVQAPADLFGVVVEPYITFVGQQFQQYATPDDSATAEAVLEAWPNSVPITVDTGIRYAADAQARAEQLLALFSVRRDHNSLNVPQAIGRRDMGSTQSIQMPRLGYDDGKPVCVVGRTDNFKTGRVTLETFG